MENFGDISGLKLNKKTKLCGSDHGDKEPTNLSVFNDQKSRSACWVHLFLTTRKKMNPCNFMLKLQKLKTILDVWNCQSLTLFGRCLITKSLGISQLVHSISNLVIPQGYLSAVNTAIFRFIWKGKKDKIKRLKAVL